MSDEPVIGMDLEDDAPPPEPAAAAPAEPAAPPVVVAPDEPAHVDAVEVGGAKYVPVGVIQALREELKQAKEQAGLVPQLQHELTQTRPYVDMLRNNPGLLQPRQPEPAAPQPAHVDPLAIEYAKLYDFFDPQTGQPDAVKGARAMQLYQQQAERVAQAQMAPYQQQRWQEVSTQNFARALAVADADGNHPSVEALRAVWSQMSPEDAADPTKASVMAVVALGLDRMAKKSPPKAPENPPLVTESSGGITRPRSSMSAVEKGVASARGMNADTWNKRTEGFQPGRSSQLED